MNYQLSWKLLKLKKNNKKNTLHEQPNELMPLFAVIARRNVYIQIFSFIFKDINI
jgi:hypothetical protein